MPAGINTMDLNTPKIYSDTLKRFAPFNMLGTPLVELLIANIDVVRAQQGYCLFDIGDNATEQYFLLGGKVKLTSSEGSDSFIEAGLPNSNQALSRKYPREHKAIAVNNIEYFSINATVLEELNRGVNKPADYLSLLARTSPLDKDGNALLNLFEHELLRGSFVLPSVADVALKIRQLIDKADCTASDLATLIRSDPAIAAKLIQAANSPIYRGVSTCDNISSAITRLGLITTKQLVTSFAVLNLFQSDSIQLKQHMETLRCQSVAVAAYSQALASQLKGFNAEEALLAGLLHNIGTLVVICYAEQFPALDDNEMLLSILIHRLSRTVGAMVLEDWGFSSEQIKVAKESVNWLRKNTQAMDYCDVIQVAKLCVLTSGNAADMLNHSSCIPAINKLQQHISKDEITEIMSQAQAQIDEIHTIFSV